MLNIDAQYRTRYTELVDVILNKTYNRSARILGQTFFKWY